MKVTLTGETKVIGGVRHKRMLCSDCKEPIWVPMWAERATCNSCAGESNGRSPRRHHANVMSLKRYHGSVRDVFNF